MPVHDWTRVISGIFHDFHETWIPILKNTLNAGILPDGYYALVDQVAEGPKRDVIALERSSHDVDAEPSGERNGAIALAEAPPRVAYTEEAEREIYARSADRVAIYHASGDVIVAYIEVVSPGNKHSLVEIDNFKKRIWNALERGCHLLVVDLHPPGRFDPRGLHAALREERHGESHGVTSEQPLGLAAYRADWSDDVFAPTAYFQPVGLGEPLPDMPLFLAPTHYVYAPLETTYLNAWDGVPKYWQEVIEGQREHILPERSR